MSHAKSSQLKARLGQYLDSVRKGGEVIVQDRNTPIARIIPYADHDTDAPLILHAREPEAPLFGAVKVKGLTGLGVDSLALLQEDRRKR